MNYEIVGYLAGGLVAFALTPQVYKIYKSKSAKDVSLLWTTILMTGLILWIIYGMVNTILPLLIFATIEFLLAFMLFLMKLIFKS